MKLFAKKRKKELIKLTISSNWIIKTNNFLEIQVKKNYVWLETIMKVNLCGREWP